MRARTLLPALCVTSCVAPASPGAASEPAVTIPAILGPAVETLVSVAETGLLGPWGALAAGVVTAVTGAGCVKVAKVAKAKKAAKASAAAEPKEAA